MIKIFDTRGKSFFSYLRFGSCVPLSLQRFVLSAVCVGLWGCGSSDEVAPLLTDPLFQMDLSARSVLMSIVAPYNTLQLQVTPRSISGHVVSGTTPPIFLTKDGTLSVTPDGVVTAMAVTPGSTPTWIAVSVKDTMNDITIIDTVYVTVTDQTPSTPLQTLEFLPTRGDSAKFGMATVNFSLPKDTIGVIANAGAIPKSQLKVRFRSSDTTVVQVHALNGSLTLKQPGEAVIEATATYYGVTKTMTLPIRVGLPIGAQVTLKIQSSPTIGGTYIRAFVPEVITIGVGGAILFSPEGVVNDAAREILWDVVFDDPSVAEKASLPARNFQDSSGNVNPTPPIIVGGKFNPDCLGAVGFHPICQGARRAFNHPGTYTVRSALYGTSGTIIVKEEP